jgi:hypothetical protein
MFTQDHELLEVIELWDVLFAHIDHLVEYLFLVGLGHVKQMADRLDSRDSSVTIHALQDTWKCDLKVAIREAERIWQQYWRAPSGVPKSLYVALFFAVLSIGAWYFL